MYEDKHQKNSSFSEKIPGLQIAWDSTSLGLLKTCPRKYQLSLLDGWQTKGGALPLTFGIHYHKALEIYDKAKALGASHEEAVKDAVRTALTISGIRTPDDVWQAWLTDCTKRNRFTLVRALVWYLEQFKDDPAKTVILADGRPAVELSFKLELPLESPEDGAYLLCGHLDRVVEYGDNTWVMDRKTTGQTISEYYFKQYNPDNQMSLYTFAANIILPRSASGVIIDAIQLAVGFNRFQRSMINRTQGVLEEWYKDLEYWIRMAEQFAINGYWPMNDTSCSKYGGCHFQEICSKDPGVREMYLKSDFVKREWDPLQVRE